MSAFPQDGCGIHQTSSWLGPRIQSSGTTVTVRVEGLQTAGTILLGLKALNTEQAGERADADTLEFENGCIRSHIINTWTESGKKGGLG